MNITVTYHIMPWEIDYALLTFTQLKKSKYFLQPDVNIKIKSALNLSSHLINWEASKLPKEYFIEKYKTISILLKDYQHDMFIYEGDELWGHLDLQRDAIEPETEYYISICPDMYFSEYLLNYLTLAVREIKNKYFVLTPQICRMWDNTWEVLTHPKFAVGPHYGWEKTTDIFDVDHYLHTFSDTVGLTELDQIKWAGWFDVYNKAFYEELCQIPDEWKGYGAYDWYSMIVASNATKLGYDFSQYRLDGQIVFEYGIGPLRTDTVNGFSNYYKNLLVKRDVSEQRENFNTGVLGFIQDQIKKLQHGK